MNMIVGKTDCFSFAGGSALGVAVYLNYQFAGEDLSWSPPTPPSRRRWKAH